MPERLHGSRQITYPRETIERPARTSDIRTRHRDAGFKRQAGISPVADAYPLMPSDICAKAIRCYGGAKYLITTIPGWQEVAFLGGARLMTLTPRIFDFDLCARPTAEASINIEVPNLTCSNGFGAFPGSAAKRCAL